MGTNVCGPRSLPLLLLFTFLLSAAVLCGMGTQDDREEPPIVRVTGRVRLTGSGPGQELVISGTDQDSHDREWRIAKEDQVTLMALQQQIVTVEGRETSKEMTFANGVSAGVWYYLRDIRIIHMSHYGGYSDAES